jgi:replicative DNA helicase
MDEVERRIIASVIKDKFLFSRAISEGFDKDLFESGEGKTLVDYLVKTYGKGENVIDPELIKQGIEDEGLYTPNIGNVIEEVAKEQTLTLENLLAYIEILKRRLAEHELLSISKRIKSHVESNVKKQNVTEFTGDIIGELRNLVIGKTKRKIQPIRSSLIRFSVELESRIKEQNKILGYSLEPFSLLNEILSGARRGFYYAVAGAPRRGKTNLMLRLAASIANNEHIPVLYYSWEQTERVLFLRLLSQETLITPFDLEVETIFAKPELSERFQEGYAKIETYMNYVFIMEGRREDTLNRIRSHALSVMQSAGTDKIAVFLDYLQKIPTSILYQDLAQQVDEVSGGIASLSLELNAPIFAVSSFDKEGTKLDAEESFRRPTMFNCTGGGDIEYDSDAAMVVVKDFHDTNVLYEKIANASREGRIDPNRIPHFDILNLYLDKNRDAPFGGNTVIQYLFLIEYNNLVEIGYKDETQERTYLKISKIFEWMLENGYLINMR